MDDSDHSDSDGGAPLERSSSTSNKAPRKTMCHTAPFTTHTGESALSVWHNAVDRPLPILYSYIIYFTDPSLTIDTLNAAHMHDTLRANYSDNSVEYRLDCYLLPNASVDDCIAHYHAEKEARGSYKAQVENYESGGVPMERLPGMVQSYCDKTGDPPHHYQGLLHVYDAADWFTSGVEDDDGGRGKCLITRVSFDPMEEEPVGEGEEKGEEEKLAERIVTEDPITALDNEVWERVDGKVSMAERLWNIAPRQRMDEGIWCEAQGKGWTSW